MCVHSRSSACRRVRPSVSRFRVAAVALLYSWVGIASGAPKTDILEFTNGDHLTGEFKGLDRGRLQFNTDATDTISIEWDKIASLETNQGG